MSEKHAVVKVEGEKVFKSMTKFSERQEFLKKVIPATIDEILEDYVPKALFFGMTQARWDKADRRARIWHMKDKAYPYFKWYTEISDRLGITFGEVADYLEGNLQWIYNDVAELYNVSVDGVIEVGKFYAAFINKWSEEEN